MQYYINGEPTTLHNTPTVAELADALGLDPRKVAIEVNLSIVPRSLYAKTPLGEGDYIEIVEFIGGG